jgi:hypothetical protein
MKYRMGLALVFTMLLCFSMNGCGNNEISPDSQTSSNESVATNEADLSDEAPWLVAKLNSVKLLGEFDSFDDPEKSRSESGVVYANDVIEDSRILIFQYDFDTLDPDEGGMVTYGGTVSLWHGDAGVEENRMDAATLLTNEQMGSTFDSGVFTLRGLPTTSSFTYSPNESHTHFFICIVSNSIPTDEITMHFSEKSTVSEIGHDFNAAEIKQS